MIMIALVFALITLYEWADWRKRHNNTAKLWRLIAVNTLLLAMLEAHYLVKENWNISIALNEFHHFLGRVF